MQWPKISIATDSGETVNAISPVIISASRATDIPAFYGEWFMRRLAAGYVRWMNPWSGKPVYVSFNKTRLIVFWSKNPGPFLRFLDEIESRGLNYYFLVTLNDYEKEGLEPEAPALERRIDAFHRLAGRIGRDRILWRFDPLIITATLSVDELLARIEHIGNAIGGCASRMIFSFIAEYAKVKKNLASAGVPLAQWGTEEKKRVAAGIADLCRAWTLPAVTCADDDDYSAYGIEHGKCIDDRLIRRLFPEDRILVEHLNQGGNAKDKGQRPACGCCMSKDIGSYNTCPHFCTYCYANFSTEIVKGHHSAWNPQSDSLAV